MLGIKQDDAPKSPDDSWIGPAPWIETTLPGPKAKALIERDHAHSSSSYTRDYPLVVERAMGSVMQDVDGNRFLDFAAGIAVCATGHCHPNVTAAIIDQTKSLIHTCGSDFYYPSMIDLMEKLAAITPGPKNKKVYLTNSGAEAVEAAMKLARYATKRKWIIGFHGAFHGRTMGALSLTCSKSRQQESFGPLVPMVAHVPYGEVGAIESTLFQYKMEPTEVAAVFVEAMQGEGGYVIPPPDFLPDLRALCSKYGILLVCDEIQSGAGRTGKWFAFDHYDIVPDMVLMAKGLASGMPLGAVIADEDVMSWKPGAQGSTYGGNPICCAAALATLQLVESGYMQNAAEQSPYLLATLGEIAEKHKIVTDVRGMGLMCAVDITNRKTGKKDAKLRERVLQGSFERGLVLLPCGDHAIRFCPPLCINKTQLDVGLKIFDEVVSAAK